VLAREGVIDEETAGTLVAAIGFRNVLAHAYGHINSHRKYDHPTRKGRILMIA